MNLSQEQVEAKAFQNDELGLIENQASNPYTFFIERRLPSLHNESVDIETEHNVNAEQVFESP